MAAKKTPKKAAPAKASSKPAKKTAKKAPAKGTVQKTPAATKVAKTTAKTAPAAKRSASQPKSSLAKSSKTNAVVNKSAAPSPVTAVPKTNAPDAAPTPPKTTHSPAFVQKQRQRLLDLRDELVDTMSGMTRDTIRNAPEGSEASGSGMHQGDAGSDAYDRDFALSVLAKEQDALYEIEQALRRIQQGSYGICELSGEKIPTPRLEAIPFARLTVQCQAQWEKEYGKRRFRPSNEVGFSGGNYLDDEENESVSLDEEDD